MIELEWAAMLALAPLPWLVLRLPAAQPRQAALRVPFLQRLQTSQTAAAPRRHWPLRGVLLGTVWLLVLLAASRPAWVGESLPVPASARDLMLVVDISGSMKETDLVVDDRRVRRIDVVKRVVGEFTARREGDRIGLILFADNAYLQAPLTWDRKAVRQLLDEARLGFAGQRTAIGDAIGLAIKRLVKRPAPSRVVVLLTDGASNAGKVEPADAARLAAARGITVHTIGVGAEAMQRQSLFGLQRINPSRGLDESALRQIAAISGGRYFRARDANELAAVYATLDAVEPVDQEAIRYRPKQQLFYWPLAAALGLALALIAAAARPALQR